jgi:hypothetical protein
MQENIHENLLQEVVDESRKKGSEEQERKGKTHEKQDQQKALTINSSTGEIEVKDSTELMRKIKILMQGQAFPKSFDTPAKIIAAWDLACSFKVVSPQRAISNMMYVSGNLGIWGELPKSLCEATKEIEDCELYIVDSDYNQIIPENKNLDKDPFAAICKLKRKGRTKNTYFFTTIEAEKAGLLRKRGPWQEYAKIMLKRRAQGEALKFEFADALMGANIVEYSLGVFPEAKDVTPEFCPIKANTAGELNQLFQDEQLVQQ